MRKQVKGGRRKSGMEEERWRDKHREGRRRVEVYTGKMK